MREAGWAGLGGCMQWMLCMPGSVCGLGGEGERIHAF